MLHVISLGLVLFGVWLLLSGFFEMLLIAFGVGSCLLVLFIARRMDVIDREGHPIHLGWRAVLYWVWLGWEIVKANIDVARRVIDPKLPIHPVLIRLKTSQKSELGQVIYANSITLTPGTVTIARLSMARLTGSRPFDAKPAHELTWRRMIWIGKRDRP